MLTRRQWLVSLLLVCVAMIVFGGVLLAATVTEPAAQPAGSQVRTIQPDSQGSPPVFSIAAVATCTTGVGHITIDTNSNQKVDIGDVQAVGYHWNFYTYVADYDLNKDNYNDTTDVQIEAAAWRQSCHSSLSIKH